MELAEEFVKFVVRRALEKCPQEMEFFEKNEKAFATEGLTDEEKKEVEKKGPSKGFNFHKHTNTLFSLSLSFLFHLSLSLLLVRK